MHKLHRQPGHATMSALRRMMQTARCKFNEQDLFTVINECGFHMIDVRADKAFATRHLPKFSGGVVFGDIAYHVQKKRYPAEVIFTDALARFRDGAILPDFHHATLAQTMIRIWISWMGRPKRLIVDSGTNFPGTKWDMLPHLMGISIVVVAVDSHHSMGRVERHVQILQRAFDSIQGTLAHELDHAEIFPMATLARDKTHNSGCGMAPSTAVNGRPSFLSSLSTLSVSGSGRDRYDADERARMRRSQSIKLAHAEILEFEAKRTARLSLAKNHMEGPARYFRGNDDVDVSMSRKKKPHVAFRVIFDDGSALVVGNLGVIFKNPKRWARLRWQCEDLLTPEMMSDKRIEQNDDNVEMSQSANVLDSSSSSSRNNAPPTAPMSDDTILIPADIAIRTGEISRGSALSKNKPKREE